MSRADWESTQKRATEATRAYGQSPHDPELAKQALVMSVGQRNLPAFLELAPQIERNLPNDSTTLVLVGASFEMFGRLTDAERVLRSVIDLDENEDAREALAANLIRQGRPHEAEPYLQHIIEKGVPDRVNILFQLAQGYQVKGEHEKALVVYEQCESVNPLIVGYKVFTQLRKESFQIRGTNRALNPNQIVQKSKSAAARRKFMRVAPVVVSLALLAYLALAWLQGQHSLVYVVNGLSKAYNISVNGSTYTLPPHEVTKVRLPEGEITVNMTDASASLAQQRFSVHTPFLIRPFTDAINLINPDGTAIVEKTKVYYASQRSKPPAPERNICGGKTFYSFDDIDYPFEPFPNSVSVSSSSQFTGKTRLSLLRQNESFSAAWLLYNLESTVGKDAVAFVAQRHIQLEPEQEEYLGLLSETMDARKVAEFLRPGLRRRPIEVEWHRQYQRAMSASAQDEEARQEYQKMVAAEPSNKTLIFLAGSASRQPAEFTARWQEAVSGESPCPYAYLALCSYHLSVGEFALAADAGLKALKLLPKDRQAQSLVPSALIAAGQYDDAQKLLRNNESLPMSQHVMSMTEEI
jgi:tetratricopeptide (TPR) repeat protein